MWHTPLSQAELRFRFQRLQQAWKQEKDFWQTSQYLDATINSVPNLVWYKDKNGIHEKVNDSFCSTVKKTKEQVQGQGHAYIWDVEYDDPVCIESERIVMESRQTKISEEIVQTGEGTRLLTTYKSPLYNVDGSVMGTVGVAIDVTQERAYKQEIVRQNQTMEMIFTSMDCGMVCHSLDGSRILSVNRAALKLLGYSSREEMNADGFDMVAASVVDEDKDMLLEAIHKLNEVGDSVSVEYRVHQKDSGAITHVMGNIKVVEENGELFFQRLLLDCGSVPASSVCWRICSESRCNSRRVCRHTSTLVSTKMIRKPCVSFAAGRPCAGSWQTRNNTISTIAPSAAMKSVISR